MSQSLFKQMAAQLEADAKAKGYKQALKDVRREFLAALDRLSEHCGSPASDGGKGGSSKRRPRENSGQAKVLQVIASSPGVRGVDIVEKLKEEGSPVHERTVRTALSRLKGGGKIVQREGGWHPIQAH
jgi:hypothetical protein